MWLLCLYSFCYIERQKLKDTTLYISLFRQSGSTVHWLQIIQITRKPSWRKAYARQRRHSKMAVSRHLGFCRTANSAIRSANPENHSLEANMEWIRCTVCEIFAFKLYCDLETGVRGHSRSCRKLLVFATPLYLAPPLGVKPSDLRNDLWCRKTRMLGLSDGESISMIRSTIFDWSTRVTNRRTDERTDGR